MNAIYANDRTRVDGESERQGGWAPRLSVPLALPTGLLTDSLTLSVVLGLTTRSRMSKGHVKLSSFL